MRYSTMALPSFVRSLKAWGFCNTLTWVVLENDLKYTLDNITCIVGVDEDRTDEFSEPNAVFEKRVSAEFVKVFTTASKSRRLVSQCRHSVRDVLDSQQTILRP